MNHKVRLNQKFGAENADSVYFSNEEQYLLANAYNGKNKQLNRPYLITFTEYSSFRDLWIFTGVYKVTDYNNVNKTPHGHDISKLEKVIDYEKYEGKLIVRYHKHTQAYVLNAESLIDQLELQEIRNEVIDSEVFNSYENIDLSFVQLSNIIKKQKQDWKTALENCKAVYLIRDSFNGKLYVGSATAEHGMLWSRWSQYIQTGHGGNKKLKELVAKQGIEYIKKHFHFSILKHFSSNTDDSIVLEREYYYHKILQTKEFGYNDN